MAARADRIAPVPALRRSGLEPLGDVPWGSHFCLFYENERDLLEIAIPFIRAGLEDGEYCMWLESELGHDAVREALRGAIPEFDQFAAAGQIEILSSERWHLIGEQFDADRIIAKWHETLAAALARGFIGLRAHCNKAWLNRELWDQFHAYEAGIDRTFEGERVLGLCTYPLLGSLGADVLEIAETHQFAIARRRSAWQVMETTSHVGAREQAARRNAELEKRVAQRTAELEAVNARLARSEQHYRFLTENMNDVISLNALDGSRVYVSPSNMRLIGETDPKPYAGIHPDDFAATMEAREKVIAGKNVTQRFRHRHANGSWRWLESSARLVDYEGKAHVLSVTRDISDRVRLEEQLQHAQKMESLGRLAGGVAHDFNNILTAVFGYSDLAQAELQEDCASAQFVREIRQIAERAQGLTRQLLTFSRREIRHLAVVDLGELVSGLEPMLRLLLRETIHLAIDRAAEPLPVYADPGQLEQVLVNLVVNARDAIGDGGQVRISTGLKAVLAEDETVPAFVQPGQYAQLSVADDGMGMSPEVAALAFEPFFTTKPAGMGTGLGLSTVFGIVKQGGGFIWAESRPGEGTTITLLVPITPKRKKHKSGEPHPAPGGSVAGLHIMVIEREETVRRLVVETLERAGATVHSFAGPREALGLLADPARQLDVLISELTPAELRPGALLGIAARSRPDLRIILASGEDSDQAAPETLPSSVIILQKPFGAQDLLQAAAGET